jgi:hypothetical protein
MVLQNTVFAILSLQIWVVTKCDFDEGINIWDEVVLPLTML